MELEGGVESVVKGNLSSKAHGRTSQAVCLWVMLSLVLASLAGLFLFHAAARSSISTTSTSNSASERGFFSSPRLSNLSASSAAAVFPRKVSWPPGEAFIRWLRGAGAVDSPDKKGGSVHEEEGKGEGGGGVEGGEVKNVSDFARAWKDASETCEQWVAQQKASGNYVDAYVIGSQKGATSQLSKHIHALGVRRDGMVKEWHFFNLIDETGSFTHLRTVGRPLPPLSSPASLNALRRKHYISGFPGTSFSVASDNSSASAPTASDQLPPPIDHRSRAERTLVLDMTVEYLHSGRSAMFARALTPHARIIVTVREPAERALSQYNMVVRSDNRHRREAGEPDNPASAEEFHKKVVAEIAKLRRCGYDAEHAILHSPGSLPPLNASVAANATLHLMPVSADDMAGSSSPSTMGLAACMLYDSYNERFDDMLYVTRGLYFLHLDAWRREFADERMLVLSFHDVAAGRREVYEQLSDFLCVRPFPQHLLDEFAAEGSTLSFGQQAARLGLKSAGFDSFAGNDRYLPDMLPDTRALLRRFYAPADARLRMLVGSHYVYWTS